MSKFPGLILLRLNLMCTVFSFLITIQNSLKHTAVIEHFDCQDFAELFWKTISLSLSGLVIYTCGNLF